MSYTRRVGLLFSSFTFRTALFLGLTILAFVIVIGNRENTKSALLDANAYERYTESVIEAGSKQAATDTSTIPINDPVIADIIRKSLDQKSLQTISEAAVDSTYNWLEGKTETIEYSADVSKNKEFLAANTANYAIDRLTTLSFCVEAPAETNVFRLPCYPPEIDTASVRTEVYNALISDTSIFKNSVLTENDLPGIKEGESIAQTYPNAPSYYRWFKLAPWLLISLAAISAITLVALSRHPRNGLQMIASSFIFTGIILAVSPLLYTYVLPATGLSLDALNSSSESMGAITNDVTKKIYEDINLTLINIAIQMATIGIITLFALKFVFSKRSPYVGAGRKSGLALSIDKKARSSKPALSPQDVPIQTSWKNKQPKRKTSALEKRFKKL